MKSFLKSICWLSSFALYSSMCWAHTPNQISYTFEQQADQGQLTVHLTPKGAIDLIQTIKPELREAAIINLHDYLDEFTEYFNENIHLRIDGQNARFSFQNANLIEHDASIAFAVDHFPASFDLVSIEVNAFLEVYQRVQNYVSFNLPNGTLKKTLDKRRNTWQFGEAGIAHLSFFSGHSPSYWFWLMSLVLLPLGWVFWKKRKMNSL